MNQDEINTLAALTLATAHVFSAKHPSLNEIDRILAGLVPFDISKDDNSALKKMIVELSRLRDNHVATILKDFSEQELFKSIYQKSQKTHFHRFSIDTIFRMCGNKEKVQYHFDVYIPCRQNGSFESWRITDQKYVQLSSGLVVPSWVVVGTDLASERFFFPEECFVK